MLWLIGMMGSGKSSVGEVLASRTGLLFVDTDTYVEARAERSITELFAEGEEVFRTFEESVIASLIEAGPAVVATGGGAILSESNREVMGKGVVVWLKANPKELAARVSGGQIRPLLAGGDEALSKLLEERSGLYQELADLVIDTDSYTVLEVCEAILDAWKR